ncbi:homocysteine S-methyltransferase family protein [Nocardioides sp. GXZ039]|uniref:homocysteine S-methyltransferase family protein n=1 Tax=Nocardioides sp. GXZ039 TaxID=3136018 RepID=UPI0030F3AA1C
MTDAGLETELIFERGWDLPGFAAFPLLAAEAGRAALADYYAAFAAIAADVGAGLLLESPTWRCNPDWGTALGYRQEDLDAANRDAIDFLADLAATSAARVATVRVLGTLGPRGDGYRPGSRIDPGEAASYHRPQLTAFAEAGADGAAVYTLTDPGEAIGVVTAAREVGLPIAVGFTVETDGRLPGGTTLPDAIAEVDAAAAPDHYLLNCAHPVHIAAGLEPDASNGADDTDDPDGGWRARVRGLRVNASRLSHDELDCATELHAEDPEDLAADHRSLEPAFPNLEIIGGCCGTSARHVAALWKTRSDTLRRTPGSASAQSRA